MPTRPRPDRTHRLAARHERRLGDDAAEPGPRVAEFLDRVAPEGIGLASITVWEILNGIGRLDPGRRRDDLTQRFQGILDDFFEDRVLDWTLADARACALVMEAKRRQGEPPDDHLPDAMLAGTAASRGFAVVTQDVDEFQNTGIHAVNPWTGVDPTREGSGP